MNGRWEDLSLALAAVFLAACILFPVLFLKV